MRMQRPPLSRTFPPQVSNYLLQRDGIDVNVLDRYGATPLDDAIRHGREIMQSMLRLRGGLRGADPALQEQHAISLRKTKEDQRHQVGLNTECSTPPT